MSQSAKGYSEDVINTAAQIERLRHQLSARKLDAGALRASLMARRAGAAETLASEALAEMNDGNLAQDSLVGFEAGQEGHISRPQGTARLHRRGVDGEGVTVAVVDSGVAPHGDFGDRIKAFKDFGSRRRTAHDQKGHGTHVAGIILGDGETVDGIAPKADLVACRVTSEKEAVKAVDWVIANKDKYSIDVLNLSLGMPAHADAAKDGLRLAAERAVAAGLVVVASAGNESRGGLHPSTIASPGISPDVITVGVLDDSGTASAKDDKIWERSSQGSLLGGKPDLIAEGTSVVSVLAPDSAYAHQLGSPADYLALSGSSQAAPMVSGAAALLLQVNPALSHADIKQILTETAQPMEGVRHNTQGAGRLNLEAAVKAAEAQAKKQRKAS